MQLSVAKETKYLIGSYKANSYQSIVPRHHSQTVRLSSLESRGRRLSLSLR